MKAVLQRLTRSRTLKALTVATAIVVGLNGWIGARLPVLVQDAFPGDLVKLDRQVDQYPHKDKVQVLVFGNSHALAGLRPPQLAAALGLPPEACFSLALPAATAFELDHLAERYMARFPAARQAVIGVDPLCFTAPVETRARFMTRTDWRARWAYAMRQSDREAGLALLVGYWFPVMDHVVTLRSQLAEQPALTLGRLVRDTPAQTAEAARLARQPYPWGYPPPWDYMTPAKLAEARSWGAAWGTRLRIEAFFETSRPDPEASHDMENLMGRLKGRGVSPLVVEIPLEQRMVRALQHGRHQAAFDAYRKQVAAFAEAVPTPAPAGWEKRWFLDADHLAPHGAARFVEWLATRMTVSKEAHAH